MSQGTDSWLESLNARHAEAMRRQDLLKAIRALSVRYVERRTEIGSRSPIDSLGKRAAFAVFFAPLHFLIVREVVRALGAGAAPVRHISDLGCGTAVASSAWALELDQRPDIVGVDRDRWSLEEARWNWRQLGLRGRTHQTDLVRATENLALARERSPSARGVIAAWSVNELAADAQTTLLEALLRLARGGSAILLIEPIARSVTPWWTEWSHAFEAAGGRADEWRFEPQLPPRLEQLSDEAGFRREALTAKSLWIDT